MPVQVQLIEPVYAAGEGVPFPQADFTVGGGVEDVVVALEADFAVGVHGEVVAGLGPQDVVVDLNVLRAAVHPDAVPRRLVDGVVDDVRPAGAGLHPDAALAVAVDAVVGHLGGEVGAELDADLVAVDLVAHDRAAVRQGDAGDVVVQAVAVDQGVDAGDARVGVVDDVAAGLAVAERDADGARGRLRPDGVVGHQDVAAGADAGLVVVDGVAADGVQGVGVVDADRDAGLAAVDLVAADGGIDGAEADAGGLVVVGRAGLAEEGVAGEGGAVVGGLEVDAGVGVGEEGAVRHRQVHAPRTRPRVKPLAGARDVEVIERHVRDAAQLDPVTAAVGVAAVQDGVPRRVSGIVIAFDDDAGGGRGEDQVGAEVIRALVHLNHVAGVQLVGGQDGADGRLGGGRAQAVVGVAAGGGGPVAGDAGGAVVHVVDADRRRDDEEGAADAEQPAAVVARDADAVVPRGDQRGRNLPGELTVVGGGGGDRQDRRGAAAAQQLDGRGDADRHRGGDPGRRVVAAGRNRVVVVGRQVEGGGALALVEAVVGGQAAFGAGQVPAHVRLDVGRGQGGAPDAHLGDGAFEEAARAVGAGVVVVLADVEEVVAVLRALGEGKVVLEHAVDVDLGVAAGVDDGDVIPLAGGEADAGDDVEAARVFDLELRAGGPDVDAEAPAALPKIIIPEDVGREIGAVGAEFRLHPRFQRQRHVLQERGVGRLKGLTGAVEMHGEAVQVLGAPGDVEGLPFRPDLAAVGPGDEDVLGGALRGLGGVAVGADVDEIAVAGRLVGETVRRIAAVDGGRGQGVRGRRNRREYRHAGGQVDDRGQRAAVEAADGALLVEVVVAAVVGGIDVADHHAEMHEERVARQAVGVGEVGALPGGQGGPGHVLPEAHLPVVGGVQDVVIGGETGLAVVGHGDAVAAADPDDVVAQVVVVRALLDADTVALGLVDGIVDDLGAGAELHEDGLVQVGVDQVIDDLVIEINPGVDAHQVRINDVVEDRGAVAGEDAGVGVVVDAVFTDEVIVAGLDARVIVMDDVARGFGAAGQVNAGVVDAAAAEHRVAVHLDDARGVNPVAGVIVNEVAPVQAHVVIADQRRRAAVDDVNAVAGVVGRLVVFEGGLARVAQVNAAAAAEGDLVVVQPARRGVVFDPNAVLHAVNHRQIGRGQVAAVVVDPQADLRVREGQVRQGHKAGVVQLHQRGDGVGVGVVEGDGAAGRGGAGEREALAAAQPHGARDQERVEQAVVAGVHVERLGRSQRVNAQDVVGERLGGAGQLAVVTVVAGRGGVLLVHRVGGVDVEGVRVLRDGERLRTAVEHGRIADQGDLDAQVIGAVGEAAAGGDPHELAVVGRGRGDIRHELRDAVDDLVQVDADGGVGGVAVGVPADRQWLVQLPIFVQVGGAEHQPRVGRLGGFRVGVAEAAQARHHRVGLDVQERAVEVAVVG